VIARPSSGAGAAALLHAPQAGQRPNHDGEEWPHPVHVCAPPVAAAAPSVVPTLPIEETLATGYDTRLGKLGRLIRDPQRDRGRDA
jgi:hypothetical protein